jgi:predicted transposase/invertase (TIGR01784 family)
MEQSLRNPHDRFFKELFSRQETVQEFLRYYLPPQITSHLDLSRLEIRKDTFIDPDLSEHFSDLLYKAPLSGGGAVYLYILFDHKSYPDPMVAYQLLRYMVKIWDLWLRQRQGKGRPKRLPLILPLVFYHGRSRWGMEPVFRGLFEVPEDMRQYLPDYQYELIDLSRYTDEEIRGGIILRVGMLLLKYIFRDELREKMSGIFELLSRLEEKESGLEYLETILRYLAGGTEKIAEEQLTETVRELFEKGENMMATLVEQWYNRGWHKGRQEGWQKGRQEGREEGRQEGRQKGWLEDRIEALGQILAIRFGVTLTKLTKYQQRLKELSLNSLKRVTEIALTVDTLTEFEAELLKLVSQAETNEGTTDWSDT